VREYSTQQAEVDWKRIAEGWQKAIALLESVPPDHPRYGDAQVKIAEYEGNLAAAQQLMEQLASQPQFPAPSVSNGDQTTGESHKISFPWPQRSAKVALAAHLQRTGATMYGAYWCGYCRRQRQLFGSGAFKQITEIECDPRGKNPQPDRCHQIGVEAYPSWEINGQLYRGSRSLEDLADLSGYDGPRNF